MNYIELINNIWNMREQGIISAHEQDLYLHLLHKCNTLFWKSPFLQSTTVLCSILSIDRNALTTRRKRLKQLGLIDFKEGKAKNRPAEYSIICTYNKEGINPDSYIFETEKQYETQRKNKKAEDKEIRFLPPTTRDVESYCHERNNTVDPHRFVDFYTAKGWMLGKNKMKDWKAAVRTWEKNGNRITHPAANYKQLSKVTDERF